MVGATGCWSVLIMVVCWGRFSTSNTAGTLCPKPAVPEAAMLVALHSDVTLRCAGCDGGGRWRRHSPHGTPRPLAESGPPVLRSVTYQDEDNYTCYQEGAPQCSVQLIVADEPQEATSLSCYHRHPTHNISCQWRPRRPLRPASRVSLIKAIVSKPPIFHGCTSSPGSETFSCSVLHHEGESARQVFYVRVIGRTACQLSAKLEADVKDLLLIGPPLNVQVTPVENRPSRLRVSWSRPEFWESGFYGLWYQVRYRLEDSPHPSNASTEERAYVIPDAVMGRKHLIQVRAREEFQENWGLWSEEVAGVPWSDRAATTQVPNEDGPPTTEETKDPKHEVGVSGMKGSGMTLRIPWIAPCVALGLVLFFFFGLWFRYQKIRIVKLQWGFLRSIFHSSASASPAPPPASESFLLSLPPSLAVTVPPSLVGK